MSKTPTAEDFLQDHLEISHFYDDKTNQMVCFSSDMQKAMIEFAKLHVEAALEAAAEKANMIGETQHNNNAPDQYEDFVYVSDPNGPDYGYRVNKDSILNAYSQENIK